MSYCAILKRLKMFGGASSIKLILIYRIIPSKDIRRKTGVFWSGMSVFKFEWYASAQI
jgi:hypothetical protein